MQDEYVQELEHENYVSRNTPPQKKNTEQTPTADVFSPTPSSVEGQVRTQRIEIGCLRTGLLQSGYRSLKSIPGERTLLGSIVKEGARGWLWSGHDCWT